MRALILIIILFSLIPRGRADSLPWMADRDGFICIIADQGLKCWGAEFVDPTLLSRFKSPRAVVEAFNNIYVLDGEELRPLLERARDETFPTFKVQNVQFMKGWDDNGYSGHSRLCIVDNLGARCFKRNSDVAVNVFPTSMGMRSLSVYDRICVAHTEGISCAFIDDKNNIRIDEIYRGPGATEVLALDRQVCGIIFGKIHCWTQSYPSYVELQGPFPSHAHAFFSRENNPCALTESGTACWSLPYGDKRGTLEKGPDLQDPLAVATFWKTQCTVQRYGLSCKGNNLPINLKNPEKLAGRCVVDNGHLYCQKESNYGGTARFEDTGTYSPVPDLSKLPEGVKNPKSGWVNDYSGCVVDDEGLKCWGIQSSADPLTLITKDSVEGYAETDNGVLFLHKGHLTEKFTGDRDRQWFYSLDLNAYSTVHNGKALSGDRSGAYVLDGNDLVRFSYENNECPGSYEELKKKKYDTETERFRYYDLKKPNKGDPNYKDEERKYLDQLKKTDEEAKKRYEEFLQKRQKNQYSDFYCFHLEKKFIVKNLKGATELQGAADNVCVVENKVPRCWIKGVETHLPFSINGFRSLHVTGYDFLFLDNEGVKEYRPGEERYGKKEKDEFKIYSSLWENVTFKNLIQSLDHDLVLYLGQSLGWWQRLVYKGPGQVLKRAHAFALKYDPNEDLNSEENFRNRLFLLNALHPFLASLSSQYFTQVELPRLQSALKISNEKFHVTQIKDFPLTPATKEMSLWLMAESLIAVRDTVVDPREQAIFQELVGLSGNALAKNDLPSLNEFLSKMASYHDILKRVGPDQFTGLMNMTLILETYLETRP